MIMNSGQKIIITEGITKVYRDDGIPVPAIQGIDITICSGEFTAIVGPSGSGKTTFLNIISGLDAPSSGSVYLQQKNISTMSDRELSDLRRDHIGFIFQAYNLIPVLTVEENIEYIMLLQGLDKKTRHRRVMEVLKQMDLEGFQNRRPPQLSGGQQQRVAIARAMVSNPSLILADEPTANLDSATGGELLDLMRHLNQRSGMTFLFSTHDKMVMERASRLIELKDGRIVHDDYKSI